MVDAPSSIILASGSPFRRRMLEAAGLTFQVVPAAVNEIKLRQIITHSRPAIDPSDVAMALAEAKALDVSNSDPKAVVIGADQILAASGTIYSKPPSLEVAFQQLMTLQGKTHALHTAVAIAQNGRIEWSHMEIAIMTMRMLSAEAMERYIDAAGEGICQTVGAYEFEGRGAQLFDKVEGNQSTIIGLPLLPLLAELRRRGVLLP